MNLFHAASLEAAFSSTLSIRKHRGRAAHEEEGATGEEPAFAEENKKPGQAGFEGLRRY